ncbi:hypothetical protein [Brevundimonas sp. TWP2-3-4b2]|uniref:hypothetical protein n=1 Tax=Brevundimonas sp. TWP2-3-4b2 TaxID=2804595 RepID=UPI003CEC71B6
MDTITSSTYSFVSTAAKFLRPTNDRERINWFVFQIVAGLGFAVLAFSLGRSREFSYVLSLDSVLLAFYAPIGGTVSVMLAAIAATRLFLDYGGSVTAIYRHGSAITDISIQTESSSPGSAKSQTTQIAHQILPEDEIARGLCNRLMSEVAAQGRKANTNLAVGAALAAMGAGFLVWLAVEASQKMGVISSETPNAMLYWGAMASKIDLAVTANTFAFFFLATYRRNLTEIKYFQNELTNIESKLIASSISKSNKSVDVKSVISSFLAVERNFILKRGESTADLTLKSLDAREIEVLAGLVGRSLAESQSRGSGSRGTTA